MNQISPLKPLFKAQGTVAPAIFDRKLYQKPEGFPYTPETTKSFSLGEATPFQLHHAQPKHP
jgi:hypothetical protein